jgi:hypothetical protein
MKALKTQWLVPCALQNPPTCKSPETKTVLCKGDAFSKISSDPPAPSVKASDFFNSNILGNLTEEVVSVYAQVEQETGVPCEILAGVHFEEGGNDPSRNLQDGGALKGSLLDSAKQAAQALLGVNSLSSLDDVVIALSAYNGGGNSNCQANFSCPYVSGDRCGSVVACASNPSSCTCYPGYKLETGSCRDQCSQVQAGAYPFSYSYSYCPAQAPGYDDPYAVNWWLSPQHDNMYLLYMRDCTATTPVIHSRPGALTVAISMFLSEK